MIQRSLWQVQNMINGSGLGTEWNDVRIQGVSIDSRTINPGNVYVPIQGERFDGHTFVQPAIQNGAAAVLWRSDVPNPPANIPVIFVHDTLEALQQLAQCYLQELGTKVIGVTGSNGKTSTKDILTSILATTYKVQKTEGNFNNHIGLPLTILRLEEDTEMVVLEMGMSAFGEIEFLSKLARPDAAIITNIGESHLMDLGSREGIATAKLEIVTGLKDDGLFVYNGDEPLLTERVRTMRLPETATFGEGVQNDYHPVSVTLEESGTQFHMNQAPDVSFFLPVLGKHNVYNALACMAVAKHFGVSWEEMKQGMQDLHMTGMRMEVKRGSDGITVINDAYNASPTSMKAALTLLHELTGFSGKIVVLGDMLELGDDEEQFHYELGQFINPSAVNYVFTYGKLGKYIAEGATERFGENRVKAYENKEALAAHVKEIAQAGDVVLVKASRGMRLEDVVSALLHEKKAR